MCSSAVKEKKKPVACVCVTHTEGVHAVTAQRRGTLAAESLVDRPRDTTARTAHIIMPRSRVRARAARFSRDDGCRGAARFPRAN